MGINNGVKQIQKGCTIALECEYEESTVNVQGVEFKKSCCNSNSFFNNI